MNRCIAYSISKLPDTLSARLAVLQHCLRRTFASRMIWKWNYFFLGLVSALLTLASASAQVEAPVNIAGQRAFPAQALRAVMVVGTPPEITLNGQPARLAPGARIRNSHNHMVLSGSLAGQSLSVNYLREHTGLVSQVWILTPQEAQQKRAGGAETQYNFHGAEADTRKPVDDGKTPYDQLPGY